MRDEKLKNYCSYLLGILYLCHMALEVRHLIICAKLQALHHGIIMNTCKITQLNSISIITKLPEVKKMNFFTILGPYTGRSGPQVSILSRANADCN